MKNQLHQLRPFSRVSFSIRTIFWHRRRFSMSCFYFYKLEGEIFGFQFTRTLFKTSRQKWDGLARENGILSRSTPNTLESHLCHECAAQRNFLTWKLVQPLLNFFRPNQSAGFYKLSDTINMAQTGNFQTYNSQ